MNRVKGQTIAEYAMVAALIAVVAIAGLTAFAGDFVSSWPGLKDRIFGGGMGGGASLALGGGGQGLGGSYNSTTTPGGSGASVPSIDPTTGGSGGAASGAGGTGTTPVETTGGLGGGATAIADSSDVLDDLVDDLQDENADPLLVALISQIANGGHDLASAQASLPQWADINDSVSTTALTEGLDAIKGTDGLQAQFKAKLDALNTYLASNAGSLSPGKKAIIEAEAAKINAIIDSLAIDSSNIGVDEYGYGFDGYGYGNEPTVDGELTIVGGNATATQDSSNTTCSQGGQNCTQNSASSSSSGNNSGNGNGGGGG